MNLSRFATIFVALSVVEVLVGTVLRDGLLVDFGLVDFGLVPLAIVAFAWVREARPNDTGSPAAKLLGWSQRKEES